MRTLLLVCVASLSCGSPASDAQPKAAPVAAARRVAGPTNSDGSPRHLPPGPPAVPQHTAIFAYGDFGTQVGAFDVLGLEWWQWTGCACFEPDDQFDIRVVVYRGLELSDVQQRYPTVKNQSDYRYLEYTAALAYLDRELASLGDKLADDEEGRIFSKLRDQLRATRSRIVAELPASA